MARDTIGWIGIDFEDNEKEFPEPYSILIEAERNDIVTLIDVDFSEYRREIENKTVKKNCTIPYWMSIEADKLGINYSRVLQDALFDILKNVQGEKKNSFRFPNRESAKVLFSEMKNRYTHVKV